jgi:hypothetical protein
MPWKKYLGLLIALSLFLFLTACTLDLEIPEYSLEFDGEILYDPTAANVVIYYTFVAEEPTHPCTYSLHRVDGSSGSTVVVPETTEVLVAGQQQKFERDLSGSEDGVYRFRVVVQVEQSPGDYIDMSFLDKTFEFYLDSNAPDAPVITLASDTYVGDQVTLFDHSEWISPAGSPVEVFYTLDGNDPADPYHRQKFSGGAIPVPSSDTPVIIRAVAIDMADHYDSFSYSQQTISFMDAESVNPSSSADRFGGSPVGYHLREISGYGFNSSTTVELFDFDGTKVISSIIPDILFNQIVVGINLTSGTGGSHPGVDPGMGTLVIRNEDTPSFPTDYLDFLIE